MDDQSPKPMSPSLDFDVPLEDDTALKEDKQTAAAHFHPAWAKVEDMFNEQLESLVSPVDKKLPADEYKIESVANQKAAEALVNILRRIKDAVTAVESTERSKPGGK